MGNQNSVNQVILVGRLAKDIEVKTSNAGRAIREYARFTLITNEVYRDFKQNQSINKAQYHTVVAWGAKAKFIGKYGRKGKLIAVTGKLRHSKYVGINGETKYSTQVAAEELTYLGPKGDPVIPEKPRKEEDDSEIYRE